VAHAANFTATVDRTEVALGEQIQLTLRYDGAPNAGTPQLPQLDGFGVTYSGPMTQVSIVNGARQDSVSHVFILTPSREGTLVIPGFQVKLGDQVFSSQPIPIKVSKGGPPPGQEDYFLLRLSSPRNELYLNELVPVDLKFYIRDGIRYRSQMPGITAEGFSEIKLPRPVESQEAIGGKSHTVYTFRTLTSPQRAGDLSLGPAQVTMDVFQESPSRRRPFGFDDPFFDSFFGGRDAKRVTITSEPLKLRVRPVPDAGKPADFTGAIGRFALEVTAKPTSLRAGEPVTLTVRVFGQGNLDAVAPPKFTPPEGFKGYEPIVKSKQADEMGFAREKTFEQVIVPLSPRASVIPPITFSYFDPEQGRYETLSRGPIQLAVQEAPGGAAPVVVGVLTTPAAPRPQEKLGVGIVYLKPELGVVVSNTPALYRQPWFLAVQGAPALALVASLFLQRQRERLRRDVRYARGRRAYVHALRRFAEAESHLRALESVNFYGALFKALQEYLGDRLNLPSSGITSEIVDDQLRPRNVPAPLCDALRDLFAACDTARFAPRAQGNIDRERSLKLARETIAALEKVSL